MKKIQFIEDLQGHGFAIHADRQATLRKPGRKGLTGALRVLIEFNEGPQLTDLKIYHFAGPKGRESSTFSVVMHHCPPVDRLAKIIDACLP